VIANAVGIRVVKLEGVPMSVRPWIVPDGMWARLLHRLLSETPPMFSDLSVRELEVQAR
jgi:hypothetical protein